jgi:5-formyltetrahydrofolate cyclo-ligase
MTTLAHVGFSSPLKVGKYGVDLETLRSIALPSVRTGIKQKQVIVIDEIGRMELASKEFRTAVLEALNSNRVVVATIQRHADPFTDIDPRLIPSPSKAASIQGASSYGRAVGLDDMRKIDFVVCGSVVVNRRGERLGKGGGYSDLEFALARQAELISETTPILTTVHPLQLVREALPWRVHDIPVDYIVTPEEIIHTEPVHPRPRGILWEFLPKEKIAAIPILQRRFTRPRE